MEESFKSATREEEKKRSIEDIKIEIEEHKARLKKLEKGDGYKSVGQRRIAEEVGGKTTFVEDPQTLIEIEEKIHSLEKEVFEFDIREQIKNLKAQIREVEKKPEDYKIRDKRRVDAEGGLRDETLEGKPYLQEDEVLRLEKEIHRLEDMLNGKDKAKKELEDIPPEEKPEPLKPEEPKNPEEVKKEEDIKKPEEPKKEEEEKTKPEKTPKARRRIAAVNSDSVEQRSRDIAAERMTEDKDSLKGVSGFLKKIWKHNLMGEYNRVKETQKIKEQLGMVGSAFSTDDLDRSKDRNIKESVLSRFMEDSSDFVHMDAGEWKNTVSPEKQSEAESRLKDAIKRYASCSDPAQAELDFKAERDRIYSEIFTEKDGSFNSLNVADNVFEFAKEIRGQFEHGTALKDLDLDFELVLGSSRNGVRTEANYSWSERMIKKMAGMPVLRFMNETTIAAGVSLAVALSNAATGRAARAGLGLAGGVLIAGGVAGLRESQAMERDRVEHARAMASGREFDPSRSPRRQELESAMYEMVSAKGMTEALHGMLYETVDGVERQKTIDSNDVGSIMSYLSQIESRISLSDKEKLDLISYGDEATVEQERTNLDLERYRAKIALRDAYGTSTTNEGSFDDRLGSLVDARKLELTEGRGGIEEKKSVFKKIKNTHVAGAVTKGMLTGLTFGLVGQEVHSLLSDSQQGLVEGFRGSGTGMDRLAGNITLLEKARQSIFETFGLNHALPPGDTIAIPGKEEIHSAILGGVAHEIHNTTNSIVKLPEGFYMNAHGTQPGVYDISFNGQRIADSIEVDPTTGNLTQGSVDQLQKAGFAINSSVKNILNSETVQVPGSKTLSAQDFVHEHADKFSKIKRLGWADNGTVRPDKNELRLWDPVDKGGMKQFDLKMNGAGSVFNGKHIDPVELAKVGKLKALISLSHDTQGHPVEVPVEYVNGKMHFSVDPKDPIYSQMFDKSGKCLARYVEVGALVGEHNGVKEFVMCATNEGSGISKITGSATTELIKDDFIKNVETNLDWAKKPDVDLPPVIPITWRTPLEKTRKARPEVSPYYGNANPKELLKEMENSGVEFDPYSVKNIDGKAVWVNKDGKPVERSLSREQERVGKYLDKQELSFMEELKAFESQIGPMNEKCRVAINIPARFEEKNLANLLDQYVQQVDESGNPLDKDLFEINIIVNRKEGEKADKSVKIVEEWKKKNPGFHINCIDIVFPEEKANVGTARKYITDLSLLRSKNRRAASGPLYIETEDADLFGVDKRTVNKLIKGFDQKPELDVLRGVQDRQPEIMQKNDLLFFERRLGDMAETFMRKQAYRPENMKGSSFVWNRVISGGWNTAFTAESYSQIGGYVPDVIGEDMKIGQKISMLRGSKNEEGELMPNTQTAKASGLRFSSSPRRFIDAMIKNRGAYDDFEDQSLKDKTVDELMDGIKEYAKATPEQIKKYENSINWVGQFVKEQMVQPQAGDVFKRVLWGIGLKAEHYRLNKENNSIELKKEGMERIIDLLKKYKESEKYRLGYKRQNSTVK